MPQATHNSRALGQDLDLFETWTGPLTNSWKILTDGKKYTVFFKKGVWKAKCGNKHLGPRLHSGYFSRQRAANACLAESSRRNVAKRDAEA